MARAELQHRPEHLADSRISIIPPTTTRPTWRVTYYAPSRREMSAGRTPESVWAAIQEAHTRSQAEHPDLASRPVKVFIDDYLSQKAATKWKPRTAHDRRIDLQNLVEVANVACRDLDITHLRRAVQRAGTAKRGRFLAKQIRSALAWGRTHDYISADQVALMDRVEWRAPDGWQEPPSRNEMARRAGQSPDAVDRGDRPDPQQVCDWAAATSRYYAHGPGLVHTGAITGLRFGELVALTADPDVMARRLGNLVDLEAWELRIRVQATERGGRALQLPKANKIRDVVIPRAELDPTGFDVREWLAARCAEALQEQAEGKNPLALVFPSRTHRWWWHGNLHRDVLDRAYLDLGWPVTTVIDANGRKRTFKKFSLHSLRDAFACTAVDVWKYSPQQLLEQGGWEDIATVMRYYIGISDSTHDTVRNAMM